MRFILTFAILAFVSHGIYAAVVGRRMNKHVQRHRRDIYEWAGHERGYDKQNDQRKNYGQNGPHKYHRYNDHLDIKEFLSSNYYPSGGDPFRSNENPSPKDSESNSDFGWPSGAGIGPAFPQNHSHGQPISDHLDDKYRFVLTHHGSKWICFNHPEFCGTFKGNLDKDKISKLMGTLDSSPKKCKAFEIEGAHKVMDSICTLCHEMYSHLNPNYRSDCSLNCYRNDLFKKCFGQFRPKPGTIIKFGKKKKRF